MQSRYSAALVTHPTAVEFIRKEATIIANLSQAEQLE
jgi:hypothetical protein